METVLSRNLVKKGRKDTGWYMEEEPVEGKALPPGEARGQGSGSRGAGSGGGYAMLTARSCA